MIYVKDMGDSYSRIIAVDNIYYYQPSNMSQTGFNISKLNFVERNNLTKIINSKKRA